MWVFTTDGFYSAVQHKDKPDTMVVRARARADLVTLCQRIAPTNANIRHTPEGDYAYRVVIPTEAWARYLYLSALAVNYPNFKDAVSRRQGWRRSALYHDVWAAMMPLQEGDDGVPDDTGGREARRG